MFSARDRTAGLLVVAGLVGITLAAPGHAQPLNLTPPTVKANGDQICPGGRLDSERLANWYFYNHSDIAKNFRSADDLRAAFGAPERQTGARRKIVDNITTMTDTMVVRLHKDFQPNLDLAGPGDDTRRQQSIASFLAGQATPLVIRCKSTTTPAGRDANAAGAPVTPATPQPPATAQAGGAPPNPDAAPASTLDQVLGNFRVRGSTDALLVPRGSQAYGSAAAATLSLSEDGTTKTTSNALLAMIGYDWTLPTAGDSLFDVIPFIGVDRNITSTAGKQSASSRENVMAGVVGSWSYPLPITVVAASNVLSATYEHIWNDIDNSQLNFLHFVDLPVVNGYLNEYRFFPCCDTPINQTWFAASPLLDVRGDLGFYSDAGLNPKVNRDYQQLGTRFGIAIALDRIKSDVTVSEIYMWEDKSTRNAISLFEADWTYNFSKDIGLKASYENGDLEATAQRIQQWLISLSVKY